WVKTGALTAEPLLDSCGPGCSPLRSDRRLLLADGRVYFLGTDPNHGYEMWSSDGTKGGTRLLVDSCPGSCDGSVSWDSSLRTYAAGGRVFFWSAADLWATDGTPQGTHSVYHSDQFLGDGPRMVVAAGERVLFPGFDPTYGSQIFVSDGSAGSAELLTQLISNAASSLPQTFT